MTTAAEYLAHPVRRHITTCRVCGVELTDDNARRYRGRWVGACRSCENSAGTSAARQQRARKRAFERLVAIYRFAGLLAEAGIERPTRRYVIEGLADEGVVFTIGRPS